ncbi:MAG: serine hydrolase [Clostridia bacterium]|nr:serine hydrolase [Clostridia bacterium]
MENWLKRAATLITSLTFPSDSSPSVVPFYPQKLEVSGEEKRYFQRSMPERFGISSARIYNMLCELEGERRANIHNLLILAGGEVIAECSRDGYGTGVWHLSHSMSKTVTGMAVGMLVDDGLLSVSTPLVKLFPEVPYKDKRFPDITVKHLLAMQTGVPFAEAGSVTETKWLETFFGSTLKFAPGSNFSYNSMNSYVLARIVARITGRSLTDFLEERLFSPLGITNYFWEMGPEGVEKGGWGLFLSPESWAKIGYMVLSGGVFEDKRILSEEWIEESTTCHAEAPMIDGDFNYAYQIWVGRSTEEILFNGMLGQNVWICPKNNLVVVVNSGNNELFQMSPAMDIIRKYLGCDIEDSLTRRDVRVLHEREAHFFDSRRWVRPLEKKRGLLYFLHIRSRSGFDERWGEVLGTYAFPKNNVSMLPLFIAGMQNNMEAGLESFTFERVGESLIFSFREGGESYAVEAGLYEYKTTVLDFRGERYIVSVMAEALINKFGDEEYRLEFLFPEMPNTRMIRMYFTDEGLQVEFSEVPNNRIVDMLLARVPETSSVAGFAITLLERRFGEDFIEKKVEEIFSPKLLGVSVDDPDCEEILRRLEAERAEESGTVRVLRSLVTRFFKESVGIPDPVADKQETEADSPLQPEPKKGIFSGIFAKLRGK